MKLLASAADGLRLTSGLTENKLIKTTKNHNITNGKRLGAKQKEQRESDVINI